MCNVCSVRVCVCVGVVHVGVWVDGGRVVVISSYDGVYTDAGEDRETTDRATGKV